MLIAFTLCAMQALGILILLVDGDTFSWVTTSNPCA